jgi:hypothetical protein
MMRRLYRANIGLVNHALGIDQGLVQIKQCIAKLLERLPDGVILPFTLF